MIAKCPKPPKDSEKRHKSENIREKVIVHATTAMMKTTISYMHLWLKCLVMTNAKVKTTVTVRNLPIGVWIQELRAI